MFNRRYVDDTFVLFKSQDQAEPFLQYMNSKHNNIRFTVECEEIASFPFLDVQVSRSNGQFTTDLFRKRTFSGLYMKFDSLLPYQYKLGLVRPLLYRAYRICSCYDKVHSQFQLTHDLMLKNGFPSNMLDTVIGKFWNTVHRPADAPIHTVTKRIILFCFPYLGRFLLDLHKHLVTVIRSRYPQVDFRIVFYPSFRLSHLFQTKDRLPPSIHSGVVYCFSCGGCNATYIGKTKRHLAVRVAEHCGILARTGNALRSLSSSSVREHCQSHRHTVDSMNFA